MVGAKLVISPLEPRGDEERELEAPTKPAVGASARLSKRTISGTKELEVSPAAWGLGGLANVESYDLSETCVAPTKPAVGTT